MAVVITPAEFKVFFPEFQDVDDALIQTRGIDIAQCFAECWCIINGTTCERQIILYLAAHFLTFAIGEAGGDPFPIQLVDSKRIGDLTVSFKALILETRGRLDNYLGLTSYGQIALGLLSQIVHCSVGPYFQI